MFNNKKAVTELVSFILLTLTIVVACIFAYFFSKSYLDDNLEKFDRDNMEIFLKKFDQKTQEILTFDDSKISLNLYFRKGLITFNDNQIYYQSLSEFSSDLNYCLDNICYLNNGGFERIILNLTSPYVFYTNFTLTPDSYLITLKNIKNENKIEITFK